MPRWLVLLRSLFSGIYTVDNMDFVLRDAYMSGYNTRAFDLDRLLHYSFFSPQGLTIHSRGLAALVQFIGVRADLFRAVYFPPHRAGDRPDAGRSVRRKQVALVSRQSAGASGRISPLYRLVAAGRRGRLAHARRSGPPGELGEKWQRFLNRDIPWKMVCQRNLVFGAEDAERASIFSRPEFTEREIRGLLPRELAAMPLRVDLARHAQRPGMMGASAGQNFLFDPARGDMRPLTDDQLFRQQPVAHRICRIYAHSDAHADALAAALDALVGPGGGDDLTNM